MRLAHLAGRATLLDAQHRGVDVANASQGRFLPSIMSLYPRWDELHEWARSVSFDTAEPIAHERLMSPVPMPPQVFAIGRNYHDHVNETNAEPPKEAMVFTKFQSCLCGPYDDVPVRTEPIDFEVEVVVVLKRGGYDIPAAQAWDHVAGLTLGQDITDRAIQHRPHENPRQFSLGKSRPNFGPMGPAVLSLDEFPNHEDIGFSCSLNGEVMQTGRTTEMLIGIPRLIAEISAITTLLPGDILFTGTPGGVGGKRKPPRYMRPGDVLTSSMERVGELRNRIVEVRP